MTWRNGYRTVDRPAVLAALADGPADTLEVSRRVALDNFTVGAWLQIMARSGEVVRLGPRPRPRQSPIMVWALPGCAS